MTDLNNTIIVRVKKQVFLEILAVRLRRIMHHDVADRSVVTSRVVGIEQDPTNTVHRFSLLCTPILWHIYFFETLLFPDFFGSNLASPRLGDLLQHYSICYHVGALNNSVLRAYIKSYY